MSVPSKLEGTAWNPKVMDLPPGDRFLVVCPHPDDDAVGCGGTIVKLVEAGKAVRVVYLSIQEGNFTREDRRAEIERSLTYLGVRDVFLREEDFPTSREAAQIVRSEVEEYAPDTVLLPSPFENHDQHLRTFEAYAEAVRGRSVDPDVAMYEVWGTLMPNLLIPVSGVMERKLQAIREHATQCADIDYVRLIRGMNEYRAAASGLEGYAEAFMHMPSSTLVRLFS